MEDAQLLAKRSKINELVKNILEELGEDTTDDNLVDTPRRFTDALMLFRREQAPPKMTTFEHEIIGEVVVTINDLELRSMCAHHLFPFFGTATISYLPGKRKVGLSKMQRALDYVANRLTDQETITSTLMEFLIKEVEPKAIVVKLEATHTCMMVRGVKCHNARTITYAEDGSKKGLKKIHKSLK